MEEHVCEICGKRTRTPYVAFLEGARLVICERCARTYKNAEPLFKERKRVQRAIKPKKKVVEKTFEIVEDYAEKVRKAREARGLKVEELAKEIAEPESEIHKIERGELLPELKVAEKLEKFLGIKLIREITEEELEKEKELVKDLDKEEEPLTLGDIVVIRKKKH